MAKVIGSKVWAPTAGPIYPIPSMGVAQGESSFLTCMWHRIIADFRLGVYNDPIVWTIGEMGIQSGLG